MATTPATHVTAEKPDVLGAKELGRRADGRMRPRLTSRYRHLGPFCEAKDGQHLEDSSASAWAQLLNPSWSSKNIHCGKFSDQSLRHESKE